MIYSLKLKNFRNYNNYEVVFKNHINIIVGPNGIGKTNILEAIYLLLITKTFKRVKDVDIVNHDNEYYRVEGNVSKKNIAIYYDQAGKKIMVGEKPIKKISEYIGKNRVIFNGPDDVYLIKGTPRERRKYFNIQLSQIDSEYLKQLTVYQKILKSKNNLLKTKTQDLILMDVYNKQITESYLYLVHSRKKYLSLINKNINNYWSQYYESTLEIKYNIKNNYNITTIENLINLFKDLKSKEIMYKNTLIGPHLDDFVLYVDNKEATKVLSEGQMKIAILSLKLTEFLIFTDNQSQIPIILLDDLFSELDPKNINKLLKQLTKKTQVIISTTDLLKIDKEILKNANILRMDEVK